MRSRIGVVRAIRSCVFTLALALPASRAAVADEAAPRAPEILWSAPPECPPVEQLRAEIDRLLRRPSAPGRVMVRVSAEVTRDAEVEGSYGVRLVISDRAGGVRERRIDGGTCAQVTDAAAVVIALACDEDAAPPAPPTPPLLAPPPALSPGQGARPARAPAWPSPSPPSAWEITALGGVDFASLPAPAPGFGLGLALSVGANRFELRATAWLPQRATPAAYPSVGADVALYAGALRFCRSIFDGRIDLAPCAGLEAGALVASGVGVAAPTSVAGPWLAPELGLRAAVHPASRLALSLEIDGLAPLARDRFMITGAGQVFQPLRVTGRAVLGLHVRFP